MFSFGYGASSPDVGGILASTLECFTAKDAKKLGGEMATEGKKLFANVGGSMLQIFIHRTVAHKYMFLSHAMGVLVSHSTKMIETLDSGDLSTLQIRVLANPEVFINPDHGRIYQYHSKEDEYIMAKSGFRDFIIKRLLTLKISMPYLFDPSNPHANLKRSRSNSQLQKDAENRRLLRKNSSTLRAISSAQIALTDEDMEHNMRFFEEREVKEKETGNEKEVDVVEERPTKRQKTGHKYAEVRKDNSILKALRSAQLDIDEDELRMNMEYFEKEKNDVPLDVDDEDLKLNLEFFEKKEEEKMKGKRKGKETKISPILRPKRSTSSQFMEIIELNSSPSFSIKTEDNEKKEMEVKRKVAMKKGDPMVVVVGKEAPRLTRKRTSSIFLDLVDSPPTLTKTISSAKSEETKGKEKPAEVLVVESSQSTVPFDDFDL